MARKEPPSDCTLDQCLNPSLHAGTMVHKIDACMLDLLDFHTREKDLRSQLSRKRSNRVVRINSQRCVQQLPWP